MDETLPGAHGKTFPGSGACSAPISVASGRKPVNLGKPETWSLDLLVKEYLNKKIQHVEFLKGII